MKTLETLKLIFLLIKSLFGRGYPIVPTVCDPKKRKKLIEVLASRPLNIDYGNTSFIPAEESKLRVELVDSDDFDLNLFVDTGGQSERLDREGVRTDFFILDRFRFAVKTFFVRDGKAFEANFLIFKSDTLFGDVIGPRTYVYNLNGLDGFEKRGKNLSSAVVKDTGTGGGGRDLS